MEEYSLIGRGVFNRTHSDRSACEIHTQCRSFLKVPIRYLHQGHDQLYPCMDLIGINGFLNDIVAKKEMHAETDKTWEFCNKTILENYARDPRGSLKTYETLLKE